MVADFTDRTSLRLEWGSGLSVTAWRTYVLALSYLRLKVSDFFGVFFLLLLILLELFDFFA